MKKKNIQILVTSLLVTFLPIAGHADDVDELMTVMQVEKQMLGGFEAMLPMIDQLALQLSLNEEEKKELLDIYRTWFKDDIDRAMLLDQVADLYRQAFTSKEIQELLEFYASPVGQKLVRVTPVLTQKAAKLGMAEAQAKQAILMEKLNPFIQKHSQQDGALERVRRTSQEKAIMNNLRMLASAADQYFLENGVTDVSIDQLIGPNKYIKELPSVDGEDYSKLDLSLDTKEWKIVSKSGIIVTYSR